MQRRIKDFRSRSWGLKLQMNFCKRYARWFVRVRFPSWDPDRTYWELAYFSNDGKLLDSHPDFIRRTVVASQRWKVAPLTAELWNEVDQLRRNFTPSKWDSLLLDAEASLPDVPSSISLANAALEIFSSWLLDRVPGVGELPPAIWEWFTHRRDHYQNPSIDDRFGDLLRILTGRSLKDEPKLWQAYRDLRSARNNFAHAGRVAIGKTVPELTRFQARDLIESAGLIIDWCEALLPVELRRPPRARSLQVTIDKVVSKEPIPPESSLEVTVKTEVRRCASLVLLDDHRRVLLFRHADGHGREFWATSEELGADRVRLLPLWTGYSQFRFADRMVSQSEAFFLMTTRFPILVPQTEDVHRRERIKEVRWWSLDEIETPKM